ncbi:ABC transporter ATP-binding protein [Rothia halotolerans]|uniref:ABC transporter ATP-binding protein n=1 Tax=Rothia halotolerans TaxID=405770 RepID=UPI00101BD1A1|nr:ATP-binding cassette domain-containing protein [Rothia halotolerans]
MAGSELLGKETSVLVDSVSLTYQSKTSSPSGGLLSGLRRGSRTQVQAVKDVSFSVSRGEFVGLVGRNGSGKSSLLRVIAGVEPATSGTVYARSTPTLIGISAALIGEMTGAENITLGCLAMGMSPEQVEDARPGIEELAGLGDAIQRPMNSYSSGMGARLRFAISRAAHPEILLVDEALSTGDAAFSDRSRRAMNDALDDAGTIFLVSHAAQTIEELCSRAIWLEQGRLVMDGSAEEVARKYRWFAHVLAEGDEEKALGLLNDAYAENRRQYD